MAEPKMVVWKGRRYRVEDAPDEATQEPEQEPEVEHKKRSPKNKQKK